jgi:hypothetical protein
MPDTALTPYRGREVASTSIRITNAGDGLSQGMAIEPVELEVESTVYVVMECKVAGHKHGPLPKTSMLQLEQTLKAGTATLVDADLVADVLKAQAEKIEGARKAAELAKEAESGTRRLYLSDDEVAALQLAHDEGKHEGDLGLVEGCPGCDEAVAEAAALKAAEAAGAEPESGGASVTPLGRGRKAAGARKGAAPK